MVESLKCDNYMVLSENRGTQYRPQNTKVLIIGTPKMVPLIWGNSHISKYLKRFWDYRRRVLGLLHAGFTKKNIDSPLWAGGSISLANRPQSQMHDRTRHPLQNQATVASQES